MQAGMYIRSTKLRQKQKHIHKRQEAEVLTDFWESCEAEDRKLLYLMEPARLFQPLVALAPCGMSTLMRDTTPSMLAV